MVLALNKLCVCYTLWTTAQSLAIMQKPKSLFFYISQKNKKMLHLRAWTANIYAYRMHNIWMMYIYCKSYVELTLSRPCTIWTAANVEHVPCHAHAYSCNCVCVCECMYCKCECGCDFERCECIEHCAYDAASIDCSMIADIVIHNIIPLCMLDRFFYYFCCCCRSGMSMPMRFRHQKFDLCRIERHRAIASLLHVCVWSGWRYRCATIFAAFVHH